MNNSIGIVIPFYNGWELFQNCKDFLENQTCLPDQVVIGDDCSTDGSYEKLLEFSNNTSLNVIVFQNASNRGPGYTRKKALEYISTEYVAFCDCDDWYEKDFVRKIKDEISEKQPDLVIFDNYKVIGDRKEKANISKSLIHCNKREVLALYPMSLCRLVVSRAIINEVEFPELYNGEDGAVVPQIIIKSNTIDVLDEAFYNYYYRTNSASNNPSENAYKGMIDAFSVIRRTVNDSEYDMEVEFLGIRFICYASTLTALKAGVPFASVKRVVEDFSRNYPKWNSNRYIRQIGRAKKMYLFFVHKNFLFPCKLYSIVHQLLIRN